MKARILPILFAALVLAACGIAPAEGVPASRVVTPVFIPLAGAVNTPEAEVSGMDWFGDTLVILPQYPGRFGSQGRGAVFGLKESVILEALAHDPPAPVTPFAIPFLSQGVETSLPGFEGWEAVCFSGSTAFLAAEARVHGLMRSWLVSGSMETKGQELSLSLLPGTLAEVPLPARIENFACEALVSRGPSVLALFEANGGRVNPRPRAVEYGRGGEKGSLARKGFVPVPALEYRLTDATAPDADGCFWVSNYLYPPDAGKLAPGPDPWPVPKALAGVATRERLIPLCLDNGGARPGDAPALWLGDADDQAPRNWEALASLPGKGFLLMTDKHPRTLLVLVPYP